MVDYEEVASKASKRSSKNSASAISRQPLSPDRWKEIKNQFKQAIASGQKIG